MRKSAGLCIVGLQGLEGVLRADVVYISDSHKGHTDSTIHAKRAPTCVLVICVAVRILYNGSEYSSLNPAFYIIKCTQNAFRGLSDPRT